MSIRENVGKLREDLPAQVNLLAATKKRSVEEVLIAVSAGVQIIGENYVQEAATKYAAIQGVQKHMIGALQRNKVKKALRVFDMIQTVDSFKIAEEIEKNSTTPYPVLIEVNIGGEESKSGVMKGELINLIQEISKLGLVKIKGLMTIAPYLENLEDVRPFFKEMKLLSEKIKGLNIENVDMEILSMGMSHDYRVAVEEGATMVRIGEGIFGPRI